MIRRIALMAIMIAAGLGVPATALAGTFTWSMPGNFTATPPGSNPDHDSYGGTPWSYTVYDTNTPASLRFSTAIDGGLSGWWDAGNGLLAENTTGSMIGGVPSGGFAMQSPHSGSVELQWLSPLAGDVSVSGRVVQANPGPAGCAYDWTLGADNVLVASGDSATPGAISSSVTVQTGTRLRLFVQDASTSGGYSRSCETALVSLTISGSRPPPTVTLNPVRSPLVTATPTLTGTASTSSADRAQVYVGLYAGSSASGKLVQLLAGPRAANGSFSIKVARGLPDGLYTAVAAQGGYGGNGFSAPVTFEIETRPPAVTIDRPEDRAAINPGGVVFSGGAGDAPGDRPQVKLALYSGLLVAGKPVATVLIHTNGASWFYKWPRSLPVGFYTVRVRQSDNAGRATTRENGFRVTVLPEVIGYVLSLSKKGYVGIRVTCPAEAGYCVGDVLAVTSKRLQPVRGGPTGRLRLLFVHVRIRAGRTSFVTRKLQRALVTQLRTNVPMEVRVGAILRPTEGRVIQVFRFRVLDIG
jgi:hypothetical protein